MCTHILEILTPYILQYAKLSLDGTQTCTSNLRIESKNTVCTIILKTLTPYILQYAKLSVDGTQTCICLHRPVWGGYD